MNTVVRARIDQATKDEATIILDTIGLTVSDAFRLMMRRIVAEKRLPFDPLVPNATTLAAIERSQPWRPRHRRLRRGIVRHPARRP